MRHDDMLCVGQGGWVYVSVWTLETNDGADPHRHEPRLTHIGDALRTHGQVVQGVAQLILQV